MQGMVTNAEFEHALSVLENNDNTYAWDDAWDICGHLSNKDHHLLPIIAKILGHENQYIRLFGLKCIEKIDPKEASLLPVIRGIIMENNPLLNPVAVKIFGKFAAEDESGDLLPFVCEMLPKSDPTSKKLFLRLVRRYGMKNMNLVLSALKSVVKDGQSYVSARFNALILLIFFMPVVKSNFRQNR